MVEAIIKKAGVAKVAPKKVMQTPVPTKVTKPVANPVTPKQPVAKTGGKTILVADDEEDIRNSIKSILEKEGYSVLLAHDGKNAIDLLKKNQVSFIVLDVMMPEMSGWDVLTELMKTMPQYKNKILFLSVVEVSEERRKELITQGAADYMTKPFDITKFVTKIKAFVK